MTNRFVVCINNDGYPASLEVRKIYEAVEPLDSEDALHIRVIDESGEDYLFPAEKFVAIELPGDARIAFERLS